MGGIKPTLTNPACPFLGSAGASGMKHALIDLGFMSGHGGCARMRFRDAL